MIRSEGLADEHRIIDVRAQLVGNMKRTSALFVKMGDDEEELPAVQEGQLECMAILTGQNTASFFHEPTGWNVNLGFTPHPTKEQSLE